MIRHALLALLRERSDHGYRLKRRFEERVGTLWRLNVGQVYHALGALEKDGLVVAVAAGEANGGYPSRRRFAITAAGVEALDGWLEQPCSGFRPVRSELVIRLLATPPGRRLAMLARIADREHVHRVRLRRIEAEHGRIGRLPRELRLVPDVALQAELLHARAELAWLEFCRRRLEAVHDDARLHGVVDHAAIHPGAAASRGA